jgi:hypothetical protein
MRIRHLIGSIAMLSLVGLNAAMADPADDLKAAYAKAETASKQAAAMAAAKKSGDAGKYDEAIALARHAEALANASIAQAKEQAADWTQAVIR